MLPQHALSRHRADLAGGLSARHPTLPHTQTLLNQHHRHHHYYHPLQKQHPSAVNALPVSLTRERQPVSRSPHRSPRLVCCTAVSSNSSSSEALQDVPQQQQQQQPPQQQLTCRRCYQRFDTAANTRSSCRFHPAMYTGGEVAKVRGQCGVSTVISTSSSRTAGQHWQCFVLIRPAFLHFPTQAIGFVRASSAPEHQLGAVVGRTGLMRWVGLECGLLRSCSLAKLM